MPNANPTMIKIEHPSGAAGFFRLPKWAGPMVADALCDARAHSEISITYNGVTYRLTQRDQSNPLWTPRDGGPDTARHAVVMASRQPSHSGDPR